MTPQANEALLRILADYPSVLWTAEDYGETVILYFESSPTYVYLVAAAREGNAALALDEARARSDLNALLTPAAYPDVEILAGEAMPGKSFVPPFPIGEPPVDGPAAHVDEPPVQVELPSLPEPDPVPVPEETPPAPQPIMEPAPAELPPEV